MRQVATALGIIISCLGCGHQKIALTPDSIESIKVFRGEPYFRDRVIVNRDTIQRLCALLRLAKPASLDTINVHNTIHSCFAYFMNKDGSEEKFDYTITANDGTVLWYKSHNYHLDSLDQYLR